MASSSRSGSYLFHLENVGSLSGMREVWEQAHRAGEFSGRAGRSRQTVANAVCPIMGLYVVWRAHLRWGPFLSELRSGATVEIKNPMSSGLPNERTNILSTVRLPQGFWSPVPSKLGRPCGPASL